MTLRTTYSGLTTFRAKSTVIKGKISHDEDFLLLKTRNWKAFGWWWHVQRTKTQSTTNTLEDTSIQIWNSGTSCWIPIRDDTRSFHSLNVKHRRENANFIHCLHDDTGALHCRDSFMFWFLRFWMQNNDQVQPEFQALRGLLFPTVNRFTPYLPEVSIKPLLREEVQF